MKRSNPFIISHIKFAGMFLFAICFLLSKFSIAQQEKKFIHEGNNLYNNKNYSAAEKQYEKALIKNKDSYKGSFNLGDAYYNQGKYEEAANQFQLLTHRATSKDTLSKAYHNLGNSLLKSKKYQESIDAYKNALKNNPNDDDTRYNLSYAQQMLRKQQDQQKKQDKNKDKDKDKKDKDKDTNKDKDKDKKDQDKNKDKQDKDKQDKDKQDQQKEDQNNISKEDAKRILDALQNDEKNVQDKVKKAKVNGAKVKIEKDW
ncbi:MAG: tetratricopeptide repeat protein [Bacteroidia bacterium]